MTKDILVIELIELFIYYIIKDFNILVSITLNKGFILLVTSSLVSTFT